MGMSLNQDIKVINEFTYKMLEEEKMLINVWNLDIKHDFELNIYWKQFFFDIIEEIYSKSLVLEDIKEDSFYEYLKANYQNIIDKYELEIDIDNYEELSSYISFQKWKDDYEPSDAYMVREITSYNINKDEKIYVLSQARYW